MTEHYLTPPVEVTRDYKPEPGVIVDTLASKNSTVAHVTVSKFRGWGQPADYEFHAAESSKREQGDRYDPVIGELLALSRAFTRIGQYMKREADKRVRAMEEQALVDRAPKKDKRQLKHRPREEWELLTHQAEAEVGDLTGERPTEQPTDLSTVNFTSSYIEALDIEKPADPEYSGVARFELADGQTLEVGNNAVVFRSAEGNVIRRVDRA